MDITPYISKLKPYNKTTLSKCYSCSATIHHTGVSYKIKGESFKMHLSCFENEKRGPKVTCDFCNDRKDAKTSSRVMQGHGKCFVERVACEDCLQVMKFNII